ncbi:MAG: tetratricopeptide repeat-containing sensor histidine kinase [Balneolaceae bacterium]|nr:tetratricopeptide repeat-containing sensor histidine kinase [Balneolaceae bacterium]
MGLGYVFPAFSVSQVRVQNESEQVAQDSSGVRLLLQQADSLSNIGDLREAEKVYNEALKRAKSIIGGDSLITSIRLDIVTNYLNSDQPDSAETLLHSMLGQSPNRIDSTQILNHLGVTYRYQGRFDEALEKHESAKSLIDSVSHPALYGKIKLNMAMVYGAKADFGTAFKYFLSSIEAAEAAGDRSTLASALNSLGVTYNNYGQPDKSVYYLQRAIEVNNELNNQVGLLRATSNLANAKRHLESYEEAIALYERALELHKEVRKDVPPFRILYNLGQLYKETGNLDRAEGYYRQSLAYCQEAGIFQGLIYNYGGLANVAELRNNFTKARDYYNRALDIAREIGAGRLELSALNSLYNLEKRLDNTAEALSYYEQQTALSDSLDIIAQEEALADTETRLSLRQQEEMNKLLQEKQQQQNARIATQNWLIVAGIIIILVILLSLYLLYRSNEEKKEINKQLKAKHQRLEELNEVKDKMLAIIAHDLRSPLSAMHGMLYLMQEEDLSEKETKQMTTELSLSLNRSINMMDNLLAWARGQMSGFKMNIKDVNCHIIVEKVFKDYALSARQKGILLRNEADENHTVKADFDMLKLILRNLISNSIKFCQEGDEIRVSTREATDKIILNVKDSGTGISEEIQKNLFTSNNRSHPGTQNEKGSGLGLQLCKEFIEKQGGEIKVESSEGKGTSMIFSFPKA